MKLIPPEHQTKLNSNPPLLLLEADLADLRTALERAHIPLQRREDIIKKHRQEREKIVWSADESLRPTNKARIQGPLPQIVPGLPGEFADYFRGAIAWHQDKVAEARSAWTGLLERPAVERQFKSTWACFHARSELGRGKSQPGDFLF